MRFQALVHGLLLLAIVVSACASVPAPERADVLVIAASPSMKAPVEALGAAFERQHPGITVRVYYDSGLDLRRTVTALQNTGRHFIGTGPLHLIAPGSDELITRLESKYYVLPGTQRVYALVPLTLVVPETLVEAPASFEELRAGRYRIAIADPALTELGRQTMEMFRALGITADVQGRLDVALDARGVLDHLLLGQADVGIILGPDAVQEQERIRVVAVASDRHVKHTPHSMAMERYCPNRPLCEQFLAFIQSPEGGQVVKALGFIPPSGR
jgi:molybdate transport system substrate-binding protein